SVAQAIASLARGSWGEPWRMVSGLTTPNHWLMFSVCLSKRYRLSDKIGVSLTGKPGASDGWSNRPSSLSSLSWTTVRPLDQEPGRGSPLTPVSGSDSGHVGAVHGAGSVVDCIKGVAGQMSSVWCEPSTI